MVIKVYVSGISGNKEVKKRQQRVLMILDSKNIEYQVIDITEPGKETDKEFMQQHSVAKEGKYPLPPQIFRDEDYCGDYIDFDEANEMDELEKFLKGTSASSTDQSESKSQDHTENSNYQNGNSSSREPSADKDSTKASADGSEKRTSGSENNKSGGVKHSGSDTEINLSDEESALKDDEEKDDED